MERRDTDLASLPVRNERSTHADSECRRRKMFHYQFGARAHVTTLSIFAAVDVCVCGETCCAIIEARERRQLNSDNRYCLLTRLDTA